MSQVGMSRKQEKEVRDNCTRLYMRRGIDAGWNKDLREEWMAAADEHVSTLDLSRGLDYRAGVWRALSLFWFGA